jgi:hypothetical protein
MAAPGPAKPFRFALTHGTRLAFYLIDPVANFADKDLKNNLGTN